MDAENPTVIDDGASIASRLERYLAAENAPPQTPKEPEPAALEPQARAVPEPAAQTDDQPDAGDVQPQDEGPRFTTAQLAQILGLDESDIDVDEDGLAVIRTKIDGQESKAKLAELRKNYQLQGHAENRVREAAEKAKAVDARLQEAEQIVQARLQQVEDLTGIAARELLGQYQSINWEALRQQDPGQYAALRQDFSERNNKLQTALNAAQQERGRLSAFRCSI